MTLMSSSSDLSGCTSTYCTKGFKYAGIQSWNVVLYPHTTFVSASRGMTIFTIFVIFLTFILIYNCHTAFQFTIRKQSLCICVPYTKILVTAVEGCVQALLS